MTKIEKINRESKVREKPVGLTRNDRTAEKVVACQNSGDGFARRKDLELSKIKELLKKESGVVYSYVATTAKFKEGDLIQTGCGLNFEGGLLTLCTCKRRMRTYPDVKAGTWIAVFASGAGTQEHCLFALMRIGTTFDSHAQLWKELKVKERKAKSAHANQFGDVYEPKHGAIRNEFVRESYLPLHHDHPHKDKERSVAKDVGYQNRQTGEHSKLLLGHANHSYLWMKTSIAYKSQHPRTKKWSSLNEFLKELKESEK